jgi:hypothetical protein
VSQEQRRQILDAALKDSALLAAVPPVVAAGFGVVPILQTGSSLTVACMTSVNRRALEVLRQVLDLQVEAMPFEDALLHRAISQAYFPKDESLNFPTFSSPDFLERASSVAILRHEKVEALPEPRFALEPARIALAELGYRTRLDNLDHPSTGARLRDARRTKLELRDDPLLWTRDPSGRPVAWTNERPSEALLLVEWRRSDNFHIAPGALYGEHVVRATRLEGGALPYVIHPSEVQLTGIERDGALVFHAYDHAELAAPGARASFTLVYYFLSYGVRLRREIGIVVHDLITTEREKLAVREGPAPWGPAEVARWFGLD